MKIKNTKLKLGLVFVVVGISLTIIKATGTGSPLLTVGIVFFLSGLWEERKAKDNIK